MELDFKSSVVFNGDSSDSIPLPPFPPSRISNVPLHSFFSLPSSDLFSLGTAPLSSYTPPTFSFFRSPQEETLITPKPEPPFFSSDHCYCSVHYPLPSSSSGSLTFSGPESIRAQPLDFFSPNLHSLESVVPSQKRHPHFAANASTSLNPSPDGLYYPLANLQKKQEAKKRRQKLSDKIRSLQKLMPWNTKMDIATMLGEAYKYVKFLQAQIKVLQWMRSNASLCCAGGEVGGDWRVGEYGALGVLNRQQLLPVLLNSPAVQTWLSSNGWCLYSVELLALMKKASGDERGGFLH